MTSLISCPGCQHKLTLPETFIGQRVKCPRCEVDFEAKPDANLALDVGPSAPAEKHKSDAQPPPLPPPGAYARTSAAPRSTGPPTIYCIECGTRFPRTENACPGCGLLLDEMLDPRPQRRPRARPMPPLNGTLPILGAMLLPAAIVCFIVAIFIEETFRGGLRPMREPFVALACIAGALCVVAATVFCMMWMYQALRIVGQNDDDYSPGLKIGLLFVPFFNLYWMFVLIPGMSLTIKEELRLLAPMREHNTGYVPGLIACVLMLIPYLQPIAICIFIAWMLIANNALQRLIRIHERLRDEELGERPDLEME